MKPQLKAKHHVHRTPNNPHHRWHRRPRYPSQYPPNLGIPIAKLLASKGKYNIRIQTRDPHHARSLALASLPNTTLIPGRADNEADLRRAFDGATHAFINTNGFAIGEKSETYWGMRIYEIAKETKTMRHYIWSNLDYALKLGGYNEKYKCGHYDGKGTTLHVR
jgi:hypothetical protein